MVPGAGRRAEAGISLIEVMLVLVIIGITAGMAVPKFGIATEQARVDLAVASLRSVWVAERLWWLEQHAFCESLDDLTDQRLLDRPLADAVAPFELDILSADEGTFIARMQRKGSENWSGELLIDESGVVTGFTSNEAGLHVVPQGQ